MIKIKKTKNKQDMIGNISFLQNGDDYIDDDKEVAIKAAATNIKIKNRKTKKIKRHF